MGIEADTSSPWMPAEMLCAISCHQIIKSVFDPIAVPTQDGGGRRTSLESLDPERRLHGVDDQGPRRGHVPRRHAVRRRRARRQPHPARRGSSPAAYFAERRQRHGRPDRPDDRRRHDEDAVGDLPVLLIGQIGYIASPDVAGGGRHGRDAQVQAGRHRPVRLRGLQAERVLQGDEEPELLEQAVPVPRRVRVPGDPGRAEPARRARRAATSTSSTRRTARPSPSSATTKDFPMEEISNNAETGYTLLHVTQVCDGSSPLTGPAGALRAGLRVGPASDHRRRSSRACSRSPTGRSRPASSATSRTPASR